MFSTANPKALLPHEMNQIEQIFTDILRARGLPRDCETARSIARQLISGYQRGIRDSVALKYMIGFDKSSVSGTDADIPDQGGQEVSAQEIASGMNSPIGPDDLDMLQRVIDRVCTCCSIPRRGKRADRLARHLTDQFRRGMSDEGALFEAAMRLELHALDQHRSDA
ncbi:hypothetical protein MZK49_23430 [Ensifer sesbaniae]|jgi:hypothetical protein|uniref:hypothetical protein n=1 Tax=Ensifer sesbaniae TaxID=1214071 RepID=UPI0015692FE3|nr:hypothetical protein [Ensifer sesbaniae]MCK3779652.1 hypothetical protein [Ensifer sesbaniae]NRQ15083.1 hypothetical protein [Ensifer sesbaniae]